MTKSYTVAAIIPTMNRAEQLDGALESVFAQTYDPIEVVVIDGGDGDRTSAVAFEYQSEYGENRVTYIQTKKPRGPSAARNIAAAETNAELLAFLDDDDRWHPSKTERQVNQFTTSDSKIALSYTGRISRTETGKHVHTDHPTNDDDHYRNLLIRNKIGTPSRVMVTSESFESVGGFDENVHYHEDWDFYLRIAKEYPIVSIPDPLVTRTCHERARSNNVEQVKAYHESILNRYEADLCAHDVYDAAWSAYHLDIGTAHSHKGDTTTAKKEFCKSLQYEFQLRGIVLYMFASLGPRGFQLGTQLKRTLERIPKSVYS